MQAERKNRCSLGRRKRGRRPEAASGADAKKAERRKDGGAQRTGHPHQPRRRGSKDRRWAERSAARESGGAPRRERRKPAGGFPQGATIQANYLLRASGEIRTSPSASAATERSKPKTSGRGRRGGRDVERRDRKGAQVESAQVGARQAAGVASVACEGKRSRRMVALGRRIGGGGVSVETAAVSNAAHVGRAAEPKRRSGGPGRSRSKNSGAAGLGALRGGPARKGRRRRRLDRGERPFPDRAGMMNNQNQPGLELPRRRRRSPTWPEIPAG